MLWSNALLFLLSERRSRKLLPVFTDVTPRLIDRVENQIVSSSGLLEAPVKRPCV